MNKSELIDAIAAAADLSKTDAKKALEALQSTIQERMAKGEDISLVGFGTFSVKRARGADRPQSANRQGDQDRRRESPWVQAGQVPKRRGELTSPLRCAPATARSAGRTTR